MSRDGSSAKAQTHHGSRNENSAAVSATGCRTHPPQNPMPPSYRTCLLSFQARPERGSARDDAIEKMGILDNWSRPLSPFANTSQEWVRSSTAQIVPKYN